MLFRNITKMASEINLNKKIALELEKKKNWKKLNIEYITHHEPPRPAKMKQIRNPHNTYIF